MSGTGGLAGVKGNIGRTAVIEFNKVDNYPKAGISATLWIFSRPNKAIAFPATVRGGGLEDLLGNGIGILINIKELF